MLNSATLAFFIILILALLFEFINGFHDTANSIATSVSTRVITPRNAIIMAAGLNFVGALASTAVAKTISSGLIDGYVALHVIASALIAAIIWNLFTWVIGLPSSSSHALIGSLLGAHISDVMSFDGIIWSGVLEKVIFPLISSPIIGFVVGLLVMDILFEVLRPLSQNAVNKYFSKFQVLSAAFMSFSHGSNDAQKTIGIIYMTILSLGASNPGQLPAWVNSHTRGDIPIWVIITCAIVMAAGTSVGGWKIIKTMGTNIIKLQPIGGFAAQTSAALIIQIASFIGAPVSTTHVMSTSIMGVGASKRFSAVRWSVAKSIVSAWVFTIPATMVIGALVNFVVHSFFNN